MRKTPLFKNIFRIADFLVITLTLLVSAYVLKVDNQISFLSFISNHLLIVLLLLSLSFSFIIIFEYNSLYKVNILITRAAHLANLFKALYYGALNIVLISLLIEDSQAFQARYFILVFILIATPLLYLTRVEILRFLFTKLSATSFKRNVLIVGNGEAGKILATKLMFENPIGLNIVGFIDDDRPLNSEEITGIKVIGNTSHIKSIIEEESVDEIIINTEVENAEITLGLIDYCKSLGVNVKVTSKLFDVVARKLSTEKYIDVPVIDMSAHYNNRITLKMKRIIDLVVSSLALIILFPLFLLIAITVKVSSPGPIFFSQNRIGKNGKIFKFYKFRSMKLGSDGNREQEMISFMKDESQKTKIINNNRVTWIGKLIRRTSLDELPQLFNVLKGDMSLVGPRPCLPYEYENYDEWQRRRVNVIPGCTGVWQVWGRSSVSFKESVILDLYYVNNMSPWFDLQLLFQTVPAILTARGAK